MSQISQFVLIRTYGTYGTKKSKNIPEQVSSRSTRKFQLHFDKFLSKLEEDSIMSNDFSSDYLSNSKSNYNLK